MIYNTSLEAAKAGKTRYQPLNPCRYGHMVMVKNELMPAMRITVSGRCVVCHTMNQRDRRARLMVLLAQTKGASHEL